MDSSSFFLFFLGPMELTVCLVVGLLLFGRRLPDVGRQLGKGFIELKRGLKGVEDEVREVTQLTDEAIYEAEHQYSHDPHEFEAPDMDPDDSTIECDGTGNPVEQAQGDATDGMGGGEEPGDPDSEIPHQD